MRYLALLLLMQEYTQSTFKPGRFYDGYTSKVKGITIEIHYVRDNPRCRHFDNCPWIVLWTADKRSQEAVIEVYTAGMNFPIARAYVPGMKDTPRDKHNPIFSGEDGKNEWGAPLKSVTQIEITLKNGEKEIKHAIFK